MNKRVNTILKNTGFLYVRLFLTMILSFYTSRVILQVLGVNDFGVYSIVGSVTATFASFRSVFSEAVLRYLNYEKGLGNVDNVRKVFTLSIYIHVVVAIIFFVIVEFVGLWLIYHKLIIPVERFDAALFVFHVSVISSVIMIFLVPYDAVIIANEKINVYALVSIFDALLRLGIIYFVPCLSFDYLKSYSFLLLLVPLITLVAYFLYCRQFDECKLERSFDKFLFKEVATYSSWNFVGNFIFSIVHEALNMMLNVFGGVIENAARNIAYQVRNVVNVFSSNALIAVKPYVIQNAAVSGHDVLFRHTIILSKLAFYLSLVISAPIILFCGELLDLWLPEVPPSAIIYTQFGISAIMIRTLHGPISLMYMSLARIKMMTLVESSIFILSLLFSWVLLRLSFPLWSVFVLLTVTEFVTVVALAINAKFEFYFTLTPYIAVIFKLIIISTVVVIVSFFLKTLVTPENFGEVFACCFIESFAVLGIILCFLDKFERMICKECIIRLKRKYLVRK